MDFKGHFPLRKPRALPSADRARQSLLLQACADERAETVRAALIATFRRYGRPAEMLMDNGAPWGSIESIPSPRWACG